PELYPYNCTKYAPALLELISLRQDFAAGREYDGERISALYTLLKAEIGESALEALLTGREKARVPLAGEMYFASDASPTLLETYFACPYRSFVARALRLREREERTVLDTDAGTFVHTVLERVAVGFNGFRDEAECRARAVAVGKELLASPRFASLTDTGAGAYTGGRLVEEGAAASAAAYRQLAASGFRVRDAEVRLSLPELGMSGTADRVDEAGEYVRVIDYKTGETDDSVSAYYTGRKLQLQLYLLAAAEGGKAAGAFYFPAADEFTKTTEEKYRMSGFFSGEDEVLSLMAPARKEGEKSAFFEGGGRTEKGMPQSDFESFLDYARLVSARAEEEMKGGNVAPSPYEGVCSYCKCLGACGFTGTPRKEDSVRCGDIVKIVAKEGEV
ncbi:MAG: PD-(D/E)XK nuclease family protein, partial [Clostridia bacterium]|nr:PD-(D/E)XK nuclease family protein [Clostridia bacterium]